MKKRLDWFPFYVDDFLLDERVVRYGNEALGAYLRLLCFQWREGTLPDDRDSLRALARVDGEQPWFVKLIGECFEAVPGKPERLHSPRLSRISKDQLKRRARDADKQATYRARHRNVAGASPANNRLEIEIEREVVVTEVTTTIPKKVDHDFAPEFFEKAWVIYPPRDGGNPKPLAFKQWCARIREGVSAAELLGGVTRYATYCHANYRNGKSKFVLQAATFFGPHKRWQEAWEVVREPKSASGGSLNTPRSPAGGRTYSNPGYVADPGAVAAFEAIRDGGGVVSFVPDPDAAGTLPLPFPEAAP